MYSRTLRCDCHKTEICDIDVNTSGDHGCCHFIKSQNWFRLHSRKGEPDLPLCKGIRNLIGKEKCNIYSTIKTICTASPFIPFWWLQPNDSSKIIFCLMAHYTARERDRYREQWVPEMFTLAQDRGMNQVGFHCFLLCWSSSLYEFQSRSRAVWRPKFSLISFIEH